MIELLNSLTKKLSEEANNMELSSYDKGILNGKEYYFVDTSII